MRKQCIPGLPSPRRRPGNEANTHSYTHSDPLTRSHSHSHSLTDHRNAIIGPVLAIGVPVVLILAVPLLLVCWYSVRKRRIRAPVVRRVARLPTRHEVILVNCSDRVVAMGTNRLHGNSSLGSGAGFEPPPSYTATPDPAELVRLVF